MVTIDAPTRKHLAEWILTVCTDHGTLSHARLAQVEGMREKIKILEGIWGDDPAEAQGDPSTPTLSTSTGRELGPGAEVGSQKTPEGVHADDGGGTADGRGDPHGDKGGKPDAGGSRSGRDSAAGSGNGGGPGGDDGDAAAVDQGNGDGDAGVDAWLISYNRRLKNELERLRERTRQAEDR